MDRRFIKDGGKYKKCKASELFQVKGNPQLDKDSFVFETNSVYPYFTRTVFNNGILGYVDYLDDNHLIKGNSLAVGMIGMQFFYMKHDFYAGQFTKTVFPKFEGFNEFVALWFIAWLNKSSRTYQSVLVRDFEKTFNSTELIVPFIEGKVAVKYIEERVRELEKERVRELEKERVRELEAYLQEAGFTDCVLTQSESDALRCVAEGTKQMKRFVIVEKFNVANSHNILKSDVIFGSGLTPYVTASEGNNSIVSYISYKPEMIEHGNSIMIGGKTLVITYQPRDFFSNDSHNLVLTINDEKGRNESAQLYMVAALCKTLGPKYSWGDSISKAKIKNDVVYLPVTSDGNAIDYAFMATYISAIKKQCIARLKQEIARERSAYGQVLTERLKVVEIDTFGNSQLGVEYNNVWMAAEPFERYKWEGFDQSIIDFFGGNQTILVGCYKGKEYQEWIHSRNIYNIRLGKTKGSMEANRELFDRTSLLVLYEFGNSDKLSAYKITGHYEITKDELVKMDYPNKKPRKQYMAFEIAPIEKDLTFLVEHHLIERLIERNANNVKGTPVFIEP